MHYPYIAPLASPIVYQGIAYIHGEDDNLNAINIDTGQIIWTFDPGQFGHLRIQPNENSSTPAISDGIIVFRDFVQSLVER